jgi:hypothetical protein
MPIEIKELVIRATAVESREKTPATSPGPVTDVDKDAIIAACVRQVMKIIKQSRER